MIASQRDVAPSASRTTPAIQRRGVIAAAWAAVIGLVLKVHDPTPGSGRQPSVLRHHGVADQYRGRPDRHHRLGRLHIDVFRVHRASIEWRVEGRSPGGLRSSGIRADSLRSLWGYRQKRAKRRCLRQRQLGHGRCPGPRNSPEPGCWAKAERAADPGTGRGRQQCQHDCDLRPEHLHLHGREPGGGWLWRVWALGKRHGLVGATAATGAAAVVGATNGVAGAFAAAFYGPVIVGGDLTVVGGAKSAAVPHPDGSHRRLYCMESPESWFEDFGKGQLECGSATIAIDPDFGAVVDLSDYHVFLTEYGGHNDLSVAEQHPRDFASRPGMRPARPASPGASSRSAKTSEEDASSR